MYAINISYSVPHEESGKMLGMRDECNNTKNQAKCRRETAHRNTEELRLPPYIFLETLGKFARDALCLSFTCWHLWTALMVTCYSETPHNDMVRLMIQSGADKYKGEWSKQHSTDGYLLDEGAPVNTQDVNGATSLSKLVRLTLINYGADVNKL